MPRRQSRLRVVRLQRGRSPQAAFDDVAVEEPLDLRIDGTTLVVTMRTPGDDFELAAGFLRTEGVLDDGAEIREMRFCADTEELNTLDVVLTGSPRLFRRSTVATAACGVCGKTSVDEVRRRVPPVTEGPVFEAEVLARAPEGLRTQQRGYRATGGLHGAGLMTPSGDWVCVREDVGRHNAVDKVLGWAHLEGRLPGREWALVVSGRAGFEIVQKAAVAGLTVLAAVGAPTSLSIDVARDTGMTLVGFLRQDSMNVYCGEERVAWSA